MITYPSDPSNHDSREVLDNLAKIRRDLMEQLINSVSDTCNQLKHSMFSSPRNYRTDELSCGLSIDDKAPFFGRN